MIKPNIEQKSNSYVITNSIYLHPVRERDWLDFLLLFTKSDGEKDLELKITPEFSYFINKKPSGKIKNPIYMKKEDVDEVKTLYKDLLKSMISNLQEAEDFYNKFKATDSNNKILSTFLKVSPNVHDADINIEDYYLDKYSMKYPNSDEILDKSYFDIEVDIYDFDTFMDQQKALAPVNLIGWE